MLLSGDLQSSILLGAIEMLLNAHSKTTLKCPKCGTDRICRAHRIGGWDKLISLVNLYPYRCRQHHCKLRFHRLGRSI